MRELQIHDAFFAWLKKLDLPYIHQSMARKSHLEKGWPDFTILFMGHVLCIEIKTPNGRISPIQEKCFERIRRSGNKVVIAYSLEMCIDACKDILCVGQSATEPDTTIEAPEYEEMTEGFDPKKLGKKDFSNGKPATKTGSRRTTVDTPVKAGCDKLSGCGSGANHTNHTSQVCDRRRPEVINSAQPNLFIANILGTDWVCRGDAAPGGTFERVRRATHQDLVGLQHAY